MKKADKSLNMIFGLFLLLIITLVVLNLFFKFTEKSTKSLEASSTEYYGKAQIDTVKQQCNQLCEGIVDVNTMIEFCGKYFKVDWNGDRVTKNQSVRLGKWEFCEEKIPCFVLSDDCPGKKLGSVGGAALTLVDGALCKVILKDPEYNSMDYYKALEGGGIDDGCSLNSTVAWADADSNRINDNPTANWKAKYHYYP